MLAPYRVLDLTDGRAELATFILAGLGADVIKVEPPGGAASRREGQLVDGEPAGLASLRFHAFNRGKRSVVLDLDDRRRPPPIPRPRRHRRLRVRERRPRRDGRARARASRRCARRGPTSSTSRCRRSGRTGPTPTTSRPTSRSRRWAGRWRSTASPTAGRCASPCRRPGTTRRPRARSARSSPTSAGWPTGEAQFVDVSVQAAVFWTGLNAMIAHAIQGRDIERNGTVLQLSTLDDAARATRAPTARSC